MITRQSIRQRRTSRGWSNHNISQGASGRARLHDRSRHHDSTDSRQRSTHGASRDARNESKPDQPAASPEEIMLKQLGLNAGMITGDSLYLKDINEFDDIQMYANLLEGSKPSHSYNKYQRQIEHYLTPFANLIAPGAIKPYCLQYDEMPKKDKCTNPACSYNYVEGEPKPSNKLIYITPYQAYAICNTIMTQMLNNSDELFPGINWLPVSKAAQLPVEVCQEFWWSFDITHIKDGTNGYFVPTQMKHYTQIDERYFTDLERRVRCLASICKESQEEPFT